MIENNYIKKYKKFLNEKVIDDKNIKSYLYTFFNVDISDMTVSDFDVFLNKIDYTINTSYSFFIDNEESDELEMDVILNKKESVICINLNWEELKNDWSSLRDEFIIKLTHELIHVIQFQKGNYLHPLKYSGYKFNELKNKIASISDNELINLYLKEPYEIMAVANTVINILSKKYTKIEIGEILRGSEKYQPIDILDKIQDKKIKNRFIKYLYEYYMEL